MFSCYGTTRQNDLLFPSLCYYFCLFVAPQEFGIVLQTKGQGVRNKKTATWFRWELFFLFVFFSKGTWLCLGTAKTSLGLVNRNTRFNLTKHCGLGFEKKNLRKTCLFTTLNM